MTVSLANAPKPSEPRRRSAGERTAASDRAAAPGCALKARCGYGQRSDQGERRRRVGSGDRATFPSSSGSLPLPHRLCAREMTIVRQSNGATPHVNQRDDRRKYVGPKRPSGE